MKHSRAGERDVCWSNSGQVSTYVVVVYDTLIHTGRVLGARQLALVDCGLNCKFLTLERPLFAVADNAPSLGTSFPYHTFPVLTVVSSDQCTRKYRRSHVQYRVTSQLTETAVG